MKKFIVQGRIIGENEPCFIIAEAGVNHNGDIELAKRLIDSAKEAGADAVKFQTFKTESLVTKDAEMAEYQKESTKVGSQYEMIKKLEMTEADFRALKEHADSTNIIFLSSPFDIESSDILADIGMPAYKIASGEITNFPLLKHIAGKGKPVILSTGMATMGEIKDAIMVIQDAVLDDILVLHCVTSYPANMDDLNLRAMQSMKNELDLPVGYSDHSLGISAPIAAVALGACVIEKHFTLDRNMEGPDHNASLEPKELAEMVRSIREVESAMGDGVKGPTADELEIMTKVRKSIVADHDIPAGTTITEDMLAVKRPGTGLHPRHLHDFIGKRAKRDIKTDEQLAHGDAE